VRVVTRGNPSLSSTSLVALPHFAQQQLKLQCFAQRDEHLNFYPIDSLPRLFDQVDGSSTSLNLDSCLASPFPCPPTNR
jgi:hypothetical protein